MRNKKILLFWEQLPICGLLADSLNNLKEYDIYIVATRPLVPFKNLELKFRSKVIYVNGHGDVLDIQRSIAPDIFICSGWSSRWLRSSARRVVHSGGVSVIMLDNFNFQFDLFKKVLSFFFKYYYSSKRYKFLVPGVDSYSYLIKLGIDRERISIGYYGAHSSVFKLKKEITRRKNSFLYIGQLVERKGIFELVSAFKRYRQSGGDWTLTVAGDGPLRSMVINQDGIDYLGFVQPDELTDLLNESKALIVPSRHDNWATVICEAAACGTIILSSTSCGATSDLVFNEFNGFRFKVDVESISHVLTLTASLSENQLIEFSRNSKKLSENFTEETFLRSVTCLLGRQSI